MIAAEIESYINEIGISPEALAKTARIDSRHLAKAFRGQEELSIEEYLRICSTLEVSYEYFFERTKLQTTEQ